MIDSPREDRLERLFEETVALPPERRAAFLGRACGSDARLRSEIERIVANADDARAFVDHVVSPAMARAIGEMIGDLPNGIEHGADPFIGRQLAHFRIVEKLGGGGMGRVYKALDLKLDRTVALKFLTPHLNADDEATRRFISEAKAASALDHPHICAIYEIREADQGQLFIAMAHYDGETLKSKIARGSLPPREALDYIAQIADGLERAHASGIVHRDIKPANVMVASRGDVKILDFGLAKIAGNDLTREGATLGTVAYMSPEQTRGLGVDARTDIWSVGVVLYEMLTGVRPFRADSDQALIHAIRHDSPKPIRDLRPDVAADLADLVTRCLEKEPERRYRDAGDLLAAVRALQASGPAMRRPTARLRVVTYASVAAVLALLLFVANKGLSSMRHAPAKSPIRSLAVLPVTPPAGDTVDQYFADGMTDLLITELSHLSGLDRVISRWSIMQYKAAPKSSRQIGRELGVDALVESSVLRAGDHIRITVSLVGVDADRVLWSDNFERPLGDVLTLQQEVSRAIARELQVRLTPRETVRLTAAPRQVDREAMALYLKAHRFTGPPLTDDERMALLEQSIAKDSTFALAYASAARGYSVFGRDRAKAERTIAKALSLDSSLSEPHAALGMFLEWKDFNWRAAEAEFRRAIELSPHNGDAHHELAQLLMRVGRCDEAAIAEQRAMLQDPMSRGFQSGLGEIYFHCRRYDDAVREFQTTLDLARNAHDSSFAYRDLGDVYFHQRQYTKAVELYQKAGEVPNWARIPLGDRTEALQQINEMKSQLARDDSDIFRRWTLARLYTTLGERDSALTWLERAYENHDGMVVYLGVSPYFDPLRNEPRFRTLLKKLGLTS